MTEDDWAAAVLVAPMLDCLRDRGAASDRKLRLFAAACCRRAWPHLPDPRSRAAVDAAERFADRLVGGDELDRAGGEAMRALDEACTARGYDTRDVLRKAPVVFPRAAPAAVRWATAAAWATAADAGHAAWAAEGVANRAELAAGCGLLRDLVGNPFRPVVADPGWLTSAVASLAQQMYELRDFSALPILADALTDAGCEDDEILGHCRSDGPHVRGCWVVDLLLGRT